MIPDPLDQPTLTIDETAVVLGIGRSAAYEAANRGEIPTLRIGRRMLVPTATLRRLLGIDPEPESTPLAQDGDMTDAAPTRKRPPAGAALRIVQAGTTGPA